MEKRIRGIFTNPTSIKDIEKYKDLILDNIKPKKDWFIVLHLYSKQNIFQNKEDMISFFNSNKIDMLEFELYYNDYVSFCIECNKINADFQLSECRYLANKI